MLVTLSIILCSIALSIFEAVKASFKTNLEYIQNVLVYRNECTQEDKGNILYVYYLIVNSIGLWIPFLLVMIIHIAMYLKLQKLALVRAASTSSDTQGQLQRISRVFLATVIAFYTCTLPLSVLSCLLFGSIVPDNNIMITAQNLSIALQNLNCCLNPFIYSKIHQKIYRGMKNLVTKCITQRANHQIKEPKQQSRGNKPSSEHIGESESGNVVTNQNNTCDEANRIDEAEASTDERRRDYTNSNNINNNESVGIEMKEIIYENPVGIVDFRAHKESVYSPDRVVCKTDSIGMENNGYSANENIY